MITGARTRAPMTNGPLFLCDLEITYATVISAIEVGSVSETSFKIPNVSRTSRQVIVRPASRPDPNGSRQRLGGSSPTFYSREVRRPMTTLTPRGVVVFCPRM